MAYLHACWLHIPAVVGQAVVQQLSLESSSCSSMRMVQQLQLQQRVLLQLLLML
jgi:hypothetical protein